MEPRDLGIPRCEVADLKGGDATVNKRLLMETLEGKPGAIADALMLNAGFALCAYNMCSTPQEGVNMAREVLESGEAAKKVL